MVVTVGSAIIALEAKEIIYGAIGLAGSLFGVATLFFLLNAPYVAVFQIAVYIGAVAVLILFTVMLVRQEKWAKEVRSTSFTRLAGAVTGLAVVLAPGDSPVLEVLALVLASAVVGALTLSKVEREEKTQ